MQFYLVLVQSHQAHFSIVLRLDLLLVGKDLLLHVVVLLLHVIVVLINELNHIILHKRRFSLLLNQKLLLRCFVLNHLLRCHFWLHQSLSGQRMRALSNCLWTWITIQNLCGALVSSNGWIWSTSSCFGPSMNVSLDSWGIIWSRHYWKLWFLYNWWCHTL